MMQGARRAVVVYPQNVEVHPDPLGVRVAFSLPPGAYATMVLEEFLEQAETVAESNEGQEDLE